MNPMFSKDGHAVFPIQNFDVNEWRLEAAIGKLTLRNYRFTSGPITVGEYKVLTTVSRIGETAMYILAYACEYESKPEDEPYFCPWEPDELYPENEPED